MDTFSTVCSLFGSEFDDEDRGYLQKCFSSLFSEPKNKFGLNLNVKSETFHKSTLNNQSLASNGNSQSGEDCGTTLRENVSKTASNSVGGNQCFDAKSLHSDMLKGVDKEDIDFIKVSFHNLLWDINEQHWTSKVFWIDHPPTADPVSDVGGVDENLPMNKSGSARTEGYSKTDKLLLLKKRVKLKKSETSTGLSKAPYSKSYRGHKQNMSRDARNDQRRLSTAYQTITHSKLLNLNELKFRKKKLRLGKSEIHGLGVFACEPIAPNEIIIEYVGQIIRHIIADKRENAYKISGIGSYCFRIDDEFIIDATKYGSLNRYINHSCSPNSYAKILVINNQKKIVIYSKKQINNGEEITYDYKMPYEDEKISCLCNTPNCRKFLN